MEPLLSVDHSDYAYHTLDGETKALDHLSFQVHFNEFLGIIGPSGCGKTTLLSLIFGLLTPEAGRIKIHKALSRNHKMPIGYMLQKDHLLEWRTVYQNVTLGLEINHQMTPGYIKPVEQMLRDYGLDAFKHVRPSQLSGGMRQRAALIRTLAMKPNLLLLDEPFSALDYQTRLTVTDDIYSILRREGQTMVMVTHDIPESVSMSDRVIVLSGRPARIRQIHTIELGNLTPLERRDHLRFNEYSNEIWKELRES